MSTPFDQLRITDAERDSAVAALGEHYAVGRLTKLEYDERAGVAWKAKTRGDLAPLFADLPGPAKAVHEPVRASHDRHNGPHRHGVGPLPLMPILFALIALTVITHLPFVILGLVAWFVLARMSARVWVRPSRRRGWR